jgi:hypothetical protein
LPETDVSYFHLRADWTAYSLLPSLLSYFLNITICIHELSIIVNIVICNSKLQLLT